MAHDLDPDEIVLFDVFARLRERVVVALEGLEERVRARLDDVDRPTGPSTTEVVGATLAEFVNVIARIAEDDDD